MLRQRVDTTKQITMKRKPWWHEGTGEYSFEGPLEFGDGDIQSRLSNTYGHSEKSRYRASSTTNNRVHETPELEVGAVLTG